MKNKILSLGRVLTRTELKTIKGGLEESGDFGRCAYYNGNSGTVLYHLDSGTAQSFLSGPNDHWCCDSCVSASWYDYEDMLRQPVLF